MAYYTGGTLFRQALVVGGTAYIVGVGRNFYFYVGVALQYLKQGAVEYRASFGRQFGTVKFIVNVVDDDGSLGDGVEGYGIHLKHRTLIYVFGGYREASLEQGAVDYAEAIVGIGIDPYFET